jgi:hypothetical protein
MVTSGSRIAGEVDERRRGWLTTACVAAVALVHAQRYRAHFSDDAFIALRYAERLATGHGLSWTDGEAVEGYSDLLWVVLLAGARAIGLDGIGSARTLGSIGLVLAVVLVARGRVDRALSGGLAIALCGGAAAWAVGGLEHTLLGGLVVALFVAARERPMLAIGIAPFVTWLRADAFVVVLAVAAVQRRPRVALAGVGAATLQLVFRLVVHGDWLPNTARAKVELSPGRLVGGLEWVLEALVHNGVLVALALLAAVQVPRARPAVGVAGIWCAYVAFVGGDLFNGYRQLVVVLPLLALAFADGVATRAWRWAPLAAVAYGLSHLFLPPVTALTTPGWALAGQVPGAVLRDAFADRDPLFAVDAAGVLPYTTGFRSVDLLGLNDRFLATHPPVVRTGGLGHDLGDGAYAASRRPDLVAFCHAMGALEPCFRSGREWGASADWAHYAPLYIATDAGLATYWVRRDGVLGLQDGTAPPWWGSSPSRPARWDGQRLTTASRP